MVAQEVFGLQRVSAAALQTAASELEAIHLGFAEESPDQM